MKNEPRAMREIHEIRIKNYELENDLSPEELEAKRLNDRLNVEKAIDEYGLKVKMIV